MKKLAIVGRPNVGKSALFNRIARKRIAIVDEAEGVTRDRIYAEAELFGKWFELVDTGGIDLLSEDPFQEQIAMSASIALEEADSLIMVVDARIGVTLADEELAKKLLQKNRPLVLAVNKIDDPSQEALLAPFYALGISKVMAISALHGYQVAELVELALEGISLSEEKNPSAEIKISLIGRPNVGKSTLLNALLEEERAIVSPQAGTTRDSIDALLKTPEGEFLLIDTAGIRRKNKEKEVVEKFAALRTENAVTRADVCLLMIDAREGLTTQEKQIATQIEKEGKGCILLLNKWDLVKGFRMEHCLAQIKKESPFLEHAPLLAISAKEGRNLEKILPVVKRVYTALHQKISTGKLNAFMEKAMQLNHPPLITGKRLRIYYLTQVGMAPPRFALFVNSPALLTDNYKRYLLNQFRESFDFAGAPVTLHLKASHKRF